MNDLEIHTRWMEFGELPKADPKEDNKVSVEVLVYTNEGFYTKARYDYESEEWYITEGEDLEGSLEFNDCEVVLYWMYFPEPPKNKRTT